MALVCAAAILAAPGTAYADPAPKDPGPKDSKSLEQVRKETDRLYHDAAVATDAYNAAEEKADQQSDEIVRIAKAIVAGEKKVDRLKQRAGAAARAQYRGGGLPPQAQLMLSDDPQKFLDNAGRMRQGQQATKGLLGELARTQEDLRLYADDASERWRELDANREAKAEAKKKIKAKIKAAEELESKLEKKERERLLRMEQEAEFDRQAAWIDSGALEEITGKASSSGKKAIKYATAQIGKPYEWGAEGPRSYDCSGLTSEAWISAGKTIPRTSQEQWKQLPRIDIEDMRPGDLIIYHEDASHVGMYIGDGAIVHAPRPGRDVTIAGAGSMKILGVVRPDK
ncbi:C40 family peptidase [Streptomyces sp. LHD-70]|uniref:C40 family peptidase n=1 Tax=Streptomyces sp. LHD-70 TaxID=3072140 RepID=UPI00280CFD11|nr:C40 family peptidase [Streptomyces sp. LHD-70]MDQ8704793.1 C40 family peptidase [Streptomyces sp. LHD-70]